MSSAVSSAVDVDVPECPPASNAAPARNAVPAEQRAPAQVIPIRRAAQPPADAALRTAILAELRELASLDD